MNINKALAEPDVLSVARNRAAVVAELRRLLPGIEDLPTALPLGLAAIDSHLPQGGLAGGGLHEVVPEEGAMTAAFGFLAAILARLCSPPQSNSGVPEFDQYVSDRNRKHPTSIGEGLGVGVGRLCTSVDALTSPRDPPPFPPAASLHSGARKGDPDGEREKIIFVMPAYERREHGRLYGHGLNVFGLDPACLILVETRHRKDTLWALEEALHSRAPAAVAGVIDQLDLKLSQRLQLAATAAGLPLLLLRQAAPSPSSPASGGGWGGGSAAATRWRVGAAEAARDRFGLFARPRWHLQLERCRNGRPGEWMVEYDHVAHRFSLAAALADPALSRRAGEKSLRQAC